MKDNQIFYKFREIDKFAIDILVNKRLYLSSWETLNDPHEAENFGVEQLMPVVVFLSGMVA